VTASRADRSPLRMRAAISTAERWDSASIGGEGPNTTRLWRAERDSSVASPA
jgi:hypothetical protein